MKSIFKALSDVLTENQDDDEMDAVLQNLELTLDMTGWNFFGIPNLKPIMEVRYKSGTKIESMDEIIHEVYQEIIFTVEEDIEGLLTEYSTVFDSDPNIRILFRNITKVILKEQGKNKWSVTFAYMDDSQTEQFIDITLNGKTTASRELAESVIIKTIADLMLKDGIEYPEESLQRRIFKFHGVLFLIPLIQFRTWNGMSQLLKKTLTPLEKLNSSFLELCDELGGDFTSKDFRSLSENRVIDCHKFMLEALAHGERRWPFSNMIT